MINSSVFLAVDLVPAVKRRSLVDLCRQARIVEGIQRFLVGEDVATARLGFQLIELFQQLLVGGQALGPRLDLATHKPSRINNSRDTTGSIGP